MAVKIFYGWLIFPGGGAKPFPGDWMDSVSVVRYINTIATEPYPYVIYVTSKSGAEQPIGGLGAQLAMFANIWVYNQGRWYSMRNMQVSQIHQAMVDGPDGTFYYLSNQ